MNVVHDDLLDLSISWSDQNSNHPKSLTCHLTPPIRCGTLSKLSGFPRSRCLFRFITFP